MKKEAITLLVVSIERKCSGLFIKLARKADTVFLALRLFCTISRHIWGSDITYFKVKNYWVYFCVIIDVYSRKIIDWRVSKNASANLVTKTFKTAYEEQRNHSGLTFHNDRWRQYTSKAVLALLQKYAVKQFFSAAARPLDNTGAESFFSIFKQEETYLREYTSEQHFRKNVDAYI